jgi:UDP-3-O-[3-hydroxymyristoyl] glucosamine N-acyltransferase
MLLHCNPDQTIFIVGTGPYAYELKSWIDKDVSVSIELLHHDNFNSVPHGSQIILGFQHLEYRKNFLSKHTLTNYLWPTFIHPSAIISNRQTMPIGVVINPQAVIGYGVTLENFCNIGILTKIGHNSSLGKNNVVSPGTMIGGSTVVGENVFFGQSCSIKDQINICNDISFAMNSVVSKNINLPGKYIGNKKVN